MDLTQQNDRKMPDFLLVAWQYLGLVKRVLFAISECTSVIVATADMFCSILEN